MEALNINEFSANIHSVINRISASHKPATITGGSSNVVILSQEDWNSIEETLYLSSIPNMVASIKEGGAQSPETCAKELDW